MPAGTISNKKVSRILSHSSRMCRCCMGENLGRLGTLRNLFQSVLMKYHSEPSSVKHVLKFRQTSKFKKKNTLPLRFNFFLFRLPSTTYDERNVKFPCISARPKRFYPNTKKKNRENFKYLQGVEK